MLAWWTGLPAVQLVLPSLTTPNSLFGSGIKAAEDEDVKTTLLMDGSLAAALSRFTVLLTAPATTTSVSVLNETSVA